MIKGVIFDLDGTLLDRDKSLVAFLEAQCIRIPALQAVNKQHFLHRFIELDQKGYVWKDKVYQQLCEEFALDISWEYLLDDYIESFQKHCIGCAGFSEILELLKEKRFKLGIITNGFGKFQMNNIKGLKIDHYFDAILISETEGVRKPEVAIFQGAMERLDLQPNETIYVGDHPTNDVDASINAGMIGVWKEDSSFQKPSSEHRTIKALSELIFIIIDINGSI